MRKIFAIVAVTLLAGCTAQNVDEQTPDVEAADGDLESVTIDQIRQRSQFADGTVLNLVDFAANPQITLTADFNPVNINVYYVSAKTTDSGSTPGQLYLRQTIALTADQTKLHNVNLGHTAFAGGYGCVFLDAEGFGPFDVFQTYVLSPEGGIQSTGGSVFTGGSYRIPYLASASKMVLAITNQADYSFAISLSQLGSSHFKTVTLPPLSTYKFDSSAYGWNLGNRANSFQLFTEAGGVVTVSGYFVKDTTKYRIAPVKAAPYF